MTVGGALELENAAFLPELTESKWGQNEVF